MNVSMAFGSWNACHVAVLGLALLAAVPSWLGVPWHPLQVFGITLAGNPWRRAVSDHKLLHACRRRERSVLQHARDFTVEDRFDLTAPFAELPTSAGLHQLGATKRRHYFEKRVNHSLLSSKVMFYELLATTPVPMMAVVWAAHQSQVDAAGGEDSAAVRRRGKVWTDACVATARAQSDVIVKAAHCVAGSGITLVPANASCDTLVAHLRRCVSMEPEPIATHMFTLPHGVVVQKLFEEPARGLVFRAWRAYELREPAPPQLKVTVFWGRVLHMYCRYLGGLTYVLRDGFLIGFAPNAVLQYLFPWVVRRVPQVVRVAEALARAAGMPSIRVDFFLARDGRWVLNEVEVVSGVFLSQDFPPPVDACLSRVWRAPFAAQHARLTRYPEEAPLFRTLGRSERELERDLKEALTDAVS